LEGFLGFEPRVAESQLLIARLCTGTLVCVGMSIYVYVHVCLCVRARIWKFRRVADLTQPLQKNESSMNSPSKHITETVTKINGNFILCVVFR
jgi:hypothetical protein